VKAVFVNEVKPPELVQMNAYTPRSLIQSF
jgi:hypothetical protein